MAEDLQIIDGAKSEKYQGLLPQIEALISAEKDWLANFANTAAALAETFGFFWVGFYRVEADELVLGPFQGPVACTRIAKGKGVCGSAWLTKQSIIVEDVDAFPGHIACASASRSEIVIPLMNADGEVQFVLDVDSNQLAAFDAIDQLYLEKLCQLLVAQL